MTEKSEASTSHEKRILFEPKPDAPRVVRVSEAEYARDFSADPSTGSGQAWPQEATVEEWEKHLFKTGLFREVNPKSKIQNPKSAKE